VKLLDRDFPLEIISDDREKEIQIFMEYTKERDDHICLNIDNETTQRIVDLRKLKEKYRLSV